MLETAAANDPNCMTCHRGLTLRDLFHNFPPAWVQGIYAKHRARLLLERQKALLPGIQEALRPVIYGERRQAIFRDIDRVESGTKRLRSKFAGSVMFLPPDDLVGAAEILAADIAVRDKEVAEFRLDLKDLADSFGMSYTGRDTKETAGRRITTPCPNSGCNAFVIGVIGQKVWVCDVCSADVCPKCRELASPITAADILAAAPGAEGSDAEGSDAEGSDAEGAGGSGAEDKMEDTAALEGAGLADDSIESESDSDDDFVPYAGPASSSSSSSSSSSFSAPRPPPAPSPVGRPRAPSVGEISDPGTVLSAFDGSVSEDASADDDGVPEDDGVPSPRRLRPDDPAANSDDDTGRSRARPATVDSDTDVPEPKRMRAATEEPEPSSESDDSASDAGENPKSRRLRGHRCDPNIVKNVQALSRTTKPCPGCQKPIFKISGCNQMACTECKVIFDWVTLKIQIGGVVHNPHYFAWRAEMRAKRPDAEAVIALGEGGECDGNDNTLTEARLDFIAPLDKHLRDLIRLIRHVQATRRPQLIPHDCRRILAEEHLRGKLSEQAWQTKLLKVEKRDEWCNANLLIFDTFIQACKDIITYNCFPNDKPISAPFLGAARAACLTEITALATTLTAEALDAAHAYRRNPKSALVFVFHHGANIPEKYRTHRRDVPVVVLDVHLADSKVGLRTNSCFWS